MISIIMKSIENNFENPLVNKLLTKHFIELKSVSPVGSTHVLDIEGLKDKSIKFWSLWEYEALIGCGALKFFNEKHGEFKSIRVEDKFRGQGYGKKIINYLSTKAKTDGIELLYVETGSGKFFEPARKLFLRCGFKPCKPFAHYKDDPNSCYYKLIIN